ncbi:NACHT domain-containing protein [Maribacter sp. SA7]|uniref:NACHT domain-containing protein n=1 Tax=Maribacter zhoushanensis TaxID=3030012 RepID=UPI0023ED786A|nr:NACHT domain-containing protein [Maribacter zhoushanensis]MDF4202894.1 NACHT domain-containing protein [Maribacter zhoushanensis]
MESKFSYLYTPSQSFIEPPIDKKISVLPIENLEWEDFEKLCLRMLEIDFSVDNCEIYGVKGQSQQGIDIYAKKENGKYSSSQCKRYKTLTKSTIDKAVNLFKKNEWYKKSDEFIFCTTFEMNKTQLQTKFNELRDELKKEGIKLKKWDKIQICRLLKKQPEIVYDFFGSEWVKLFNGIEKLELITRKRRLDSNGCAKLRNELFEFYSVIFNFHDSGIGVQELKSDLYSLQERFIMPDAYEYSNSENYQEILEDDSNEISKDFKESLNTLLPEIYENQKNNALIDLNSRKSFTKETLVQRRVNIDSELTKNRKSIVLGDPGSGKSTLLRNITLDILSSKPRFLITAKNWGKLLPIWMPFAFITKNLKEDNNLSLSDLLRIWFKSHENEAFIDLINEALNDERLILLIDGIDELADLSSAQHAISKIEIQSELTNSKLIYSSRPYGYKLLIDSFPKIAEIHLLPFSDIQQRKFIYYWFEKWVTTIVKRGADYSEKMTSDFINDLNRNAELKKLAETPLLLSIIITQRLRDAILPNNKTKALEKITDYLITIHPKKRKTSAGITEIKRYNFELIDVFEELAIYIQKNFNDGVIEKEDAKNVIQKYLVQLMDFKGPEAKMHSSEIFDIGANDYGIIIEKNSNEIAFTHRLFQEYLAARYMYNSEDEYKDILSVFGGIPLWNQVIQLYFSIIPNSRTKQFTNSIDLIGNKNNDYNELIKLQKYDIALSYNNSPITLAKKYFNDILPLFELETNYSKKKSYWEILLNALNNAKLKSLVKEYLFQYFPNYYKFQDYRISSMRRIDKGDITKSQSKFLIHSLINGNIHQKVDASNTIQLFIEDDWLYSEVKKLLDKTNNPAIFPFLINCFITKNVVKKHKLEVLQRAKNLEHPDILFFKIKLKVHLRTHSKEDFKNLIKIQRDIGWEFREDTLNILIDGWPKDEDLFKLCLESVKKHRGHRGGGIEKETAWKVLFHEFNNEDLVIERIISEIETEEYPFIGFHSYDVWSYISNYFRDNKKLIPVVDQWILKQQYREPEVCFASQVGRTDEIKEHLLKHLSDAHFSHWITQALLVGWEGDSQVIKVLKEYFVGDKIGRKASFHYLHPVFENDKKTGIEIAEDTIFDRSSDYRDRAIDGLIKLDRDYFKDNILERFIVDELSLIPEDNFWHTSQSIALSLINNFKDEEVVKKMAFGYFLKNPNNHYLLIQSYPKETKTIDKLLKVSAPLSTQLRADLVEKFEEQSIVDEDIIKKLSEFDNDCDNAIMLSAAINYFKQLQNTDPSRIIDVCKKKIFYRGHDYEEQRQVAFCGYLMTKQLKLYFSQKDGKEKKPNPQISFSHGRNEISDSLAELLIENFEYLYEEINGDFNQLARYSSEDSQAHWGFWGRYSTVASPSYKYIMDYVKENQSSINNGDLLKFLDRVAPNSLLLKNICLRLTKENSVLGGQLLGKNFYDDDNVYSELIKIDRFFNNEAKIVALSIGWPKAPILKEVFNEIKDRYLGLDMDNYAFYHLKFLFNNASRLMLFFEEIFRDIVRSKHLHKFFINQLKSRLEKDNNLQLKIKKDLMKTDSINAKISFYSILTYLNIVDEEVLSWREAQKEMKTTNEYGYNVITNEIDLFSEILNPLSYIV